MYKLGIPNGCWDMLGIQVVLKPSVSREQPHSGADVAAGKQRSCDRLHRYMRSPPLLVRLNENEELPATTDVIMKGDAVHRSDNVRLIALCSLQHFYIVSCLLKQRKSKCFMHHRFLEGGSRAEKQGRFLNTAFWKPKRNPSIFATHYSLAQSY